ncbi:kinase-like protein [Panus rudis PR-1116 ss-1]|nr:kinase-like protein [Panus rudis PR-1116 ss-1]
MQSEKNPYSNVSNVVGGLHFRLYSQRATDNSSQVSIVDECSLNGTAVNGQLLTPSVPRKLVNMDRISICEADGNVILECIFTQYKTDTFCCLFEKREKLGSGGFGKVHEYRERQTGALFAVKRLKHDGMRLADETDAIEKEIRVAKSLKHRTIIKLYNVYCENDKTYMLMEIAPAGSLLQYIIRLGALEERSAQFVFMDIVHALQYLHDERHLIHRDIKPGNILLMSTSPFRAKLGDFGLCRLIDRNNEMASNLLACTDQFAHFQGSQVPSGRYSFSADVWSMGAVLYTMMTGKKPFPDGQLVFKDGTVVDTRAPMPSFKNVSGITQNCECPVYIPTMRDSQQH